MSVLVEFAMFPTDKGASVSEYVSRIVKMIKETKVSYQLTPMGSIFEVDTMEEAMQIIQKSYQELEPDCERVYATVKLDIRKNAKNCMNKKIESIEKRLA